MFFPLRFKDNDIDEKHIHKDQVIYPSTRSTSYFSLDSKEKNKQLDNMIRILEVTRC